MTEVVEEAIKGLEATDELIEEIADTVDIPNVKLLVSVTGVLALAGGVALGYFIATKRLETKYSKLAEAEIAEMEEYFAAKELARMTKPDLQDLVPPEEAVVVAETEEVVQTQQTVIGVQPTGDRVVRDVPDYMKNADGSVTTVGEDGTPVKSHYPSPVDQNVFDTETPDGLGDGWDFATETKLRAGDASKPYVIHQSEMGEAHGPDEVGLDCTTYTYYTEDDVLADERDRALSPAEVEKMVGEQNLKRFGQGSGDPNVVLVRNPTIGQEFEIVKSDQSYNRDVLGFDDEEDALKHYDMPSAGRKRRWDDE